MNHIDANVISLRYKPEINIIGLFVHGYLENEQSILKDLWAMHVYRYKGILKLNSVEYQFKPGMASFIPPDTLSEWEFPLSAPHYCTHFRIKRSRCENHAVPVLVDLQDQYESVCEKYEEMIGLFAHHPLRAEIKLWDLLTTLICDEKTELRFAAQPILGITCEYIEKHLADKIAVSDITQHLNISHNLLVSLFKKKFGCTVTHYIRKKRVRKALYLLYHSTLTIKLIALEIGIPDLQYFNKTIRKELGISPRKIRDNWLLKKEKIDFDF